VKVLKSAELRSGIKFYLKNNIYKKKSIISVADGNPVTLEKEEEDSIIERGGTD
jgi:chromatin assembly factor 1 subunit B